MINNCKCALCGVDFYKRESSKKNSKSGLFFCNRKCKDKAQKIGGIKEIQPSHYGKADGKYSYRIKALESKEHKCEKCGYQEHPEILEVHHLDRDRKNNELSNLVILCPNCHMWEHFQSKDGRYTSNK